MRRLETELADRVLRFDGVSILQPDDIAYAFAKGLKPADIRTTELSAEVEQFNANVAPEEQLQVATLEPIRVDLTWRLPPEYQELNLENHIQRVFASRSDVLSRYTEQQVEEAIERVASELIEIQRRGMVEFLKTVIYVLDVFRSQNVVWGVGRGSSCASYVLFLLGLHVVDCVRLGVPMIEFFHD